MFPRLTRRTLLLFLFLVADSLVLYIVFVPPVVPGHISSHPYYHYDLDASDPRSPPGQTCRLPRLHPLDPAVWPHFRGGQGPLACRGGPAFTFARGGGVWVNGTSVGQGGWKVGKNLHCYWRNVRRAGGKEEDDDKVVYEEEFPLHEDGTLLPAHVYLVQVRCQNFAGVAVYEQLHYIIRNSTKRQKTAKLANHVNVLIFGIDSMSRLAFIRLLPRTYRYLTETLNVTVFRGMNKIGDNTFPNLVALLTGDKAYGGGLPDHPDGYDDWPLIWRNYSRAGYATMYAEDFIQFGLFQYLDKGFRRPPTDHYLRPFWLAVEESNLLKFSSHMCYGPTPKHMLQVNYVREFVSACSGGGRPYFGFSFLAELSHEYLSRVASADEQFEEFFRFLLEGGHLKDTLLVVMSDHGHRFDAIRSTPVGHIEERMPFFSMRLPPTVTATHPRLLETLSANTGRLLTPYDTHATLDDLLHYAAANRPLGRSPPPQGTLGRSLFKRAPLGRTCESAHIPPHYCVCESESPIPGSDPRAVSAAEATVRRLNDLIQDGGRDIARRCSVLSLGTVKSASVVRTAEKGADDSFKIRVVVVAHPSGGLFEATVMGGKETRVLGDVSRINPYKEQSECIRHVILRKYCHCLGNRGMNKTQIRAS